MVYPVNASKCSAAQPPNELCVALRATCTYPQPIERSQPDFDPKEIETGRYISQSETVFWVQSHEKAQFLPQQPKQGENLMKFTGTKDGDLCQLELLDHEENTTDELWIKDDIPVQAAVYVQR